MDKLLLGTTQGTPVSDDSPAKTNNGVNHGFKVVRDVFCPPTVGILTFSKTKLIQGPWPPSRGLVTTGIYFQAFLNGVLGRLLLYRESSGCVASYQNELRRLQRFFSRQDMGSFFSGSPLGFVGNLMSTPHRQKTTFRFQAARHLVEGFVPSCDTCCFYPPSETMGNVDKKNH